MNESASARPRVPRGALMTGRERRAPDRRPRRLWALAALAGLCLLLAGCKLNLTDSSPPVHVPPGYLPASRIVLSPDRTVAAFVHVAGPHYLTHVRVAEVATGRLLATVTDTHGVDGAALSPGGKLLATLDVNGTTRLWDTATGKVIATLADPNGVNGESGQTAAFSPDGTTLAVADAAGNILLWHPATRHLAGEFRYPGTSSIAGIAFSPDGKTLAIFNNNHHTYLTALPAGAPVVTLPDPSRSGGPSAVTFSPGGATLATIEGQATCLWDTATGARTACLPDLRGAVDGAAFSPRGHILAYYDWGRVYLLNTATLHLTATLTTPQQIQALAFSPDGTTLIAIYGNGTTRQWAIT